MANLIPEKLKVRQKKKKHPHLGAFLIELYDYCPQCGEYLSNPETEIDILRCSICRKPVASQDYKFCPWCGTAFDK